MRIFAMAAAALAGQILAQPVAAASLDDVLGGIDQRSGDLARVETELRSEDRNRRIAVMEALLVSGDVAFVRAAREAGLTSSDPVMRAAALKATFDAGGVYRVEFAMTGDEKEMTNIFGFLGVGDGSWSGDRKTGFYSLTLGPYSAESHCWTDARGNCAFSLSGEEVVAQLAVLNHRGGTTLRLDETGALTGSFVVNGKGNPVGMRIPLLD